MQAVSARMITGKRVLLRMDFDVSIQDGKVLDDYRLRAGLKTFELCLDNALSVVLFGHIGRPQGKVIPALSVGPIVNWFENQYPILKLPNGKLHILENLRFESGEDDCDEAYASSLASLGDFFVNEAFAAHHKSSSTYLLPQILPHAAGLRFAFEVEKLLEVRNAPKRPLIAIIGGKKVEDKYNAVSTLSKFCDAVLVGGLLAKEIRERQLNVSGNVILGTLTAEGTDISQDTIRVFADVLSKARQVIWGGPLGKYEYANGNVADEKLAEIITRLNIETIIGGGDTTTALVKFLPYFSFVSTGGGAMLKILSDGTLPTVEVLQ